MPRKRYWKKNRQSLHTNVTDDPHDTDLTEDSGLAKNRISDMTEDTGLYKNSKKDTTINLTEDTGLYKNSKKDSEDTVLEKNSKNASAIDTFELSDEISRFKQTLIQTCNYCIQSKKEIKHSIWAKFSQSSLRFSSISRGRQCTCNALMFLLYSRKVQIFSSCLIDDILLKGDELYNSVIFGLKEDHRFKSYLLKFEELPSTLHIDSYTYNIIKEDPLWGTITDVPNIAFAQSLDSAISQMLQQTGMGLIIAGAISSALFKDENGCFMFFDSHSHGHDALSSIGGKAIFLVFHEYEDLLSYLYAFYESLGIPLDFPFELQPLSVEMHSLESKSVTSAHCNEQGNSSKQHDNLASYFKHQAQMDMQYKSKVRLMPQNIQTNILQENSLGKERMIAGKLHKVMSRKQYMKKYMQTKRKDNAFRMLEREKGLISKRDARQKKQFKNKEKLDKQELRADPEFRDKEGKMELESKQKARQDPEFREKEKLTELKSKQKARKDPEFRKKEKLDKQEAREDPEFRDKEREIELESKQKAREDPHFRKKEKLDKQEAREDPEFRDKEREIELESKQKAREDPHFRKKEKLDKQEAREDPEFRDKEREMELESKQKARQDPQFREKEREIELESKQKARQDPHFRKKEKLDKQEAREDPEFRDKEREIELESKQKARQDPHFRKKEKLDKQEAREDPEFRDKEREIELESKQKARQDPHFRKKEKLDKQEAREDPEFRDKEREMELESKQKARQDPHFRKKEKQTELKSKQKAREDHDFRIKEKEDKKTARENEYFRKQESIRDLKRKHKAREDPFFQECERTLKQQCRKDANSKEIEKRADKTRKSEKRKSVDFVENEQAIAKRRKYGSTIEECIQKFHDKIRMGPVFICTCCHQTWFCHSVVNSDRLKISYQQYPEYFTGIKSVDGKEWICHTCSAAIKDGKVPKLSVANGMKWPDKPKELHLRPLEERLVSLRIPFMQLRELPRGGQYSAKGNVVNVPVDVQPTINALPRKMDENFTVAVKLKKRLSHRSSNFTENVRPTAVLAALHWLMNHSELYRNSGIDIDESWFRDITNSAEEIVKEFTGNTQPSNNDIIDENSVEESDNFSEIATDENILGNSDTLVDEADADTSKVYTFAPGENQRPISLYEDKDSEYLSFPSIFCGQKRPENNERKVPVSYSDTAKWELRSLDRRAAQSVPNIFFKLKKIQMKQISDKVNLAIRRCKTKGKKITAAQARDPVTTNDIVKHDDGYYIFKTLRNSPAYLQARKKDVFAMIRQLGLPTWFISLSSADTRWPDLLKILAKRNYNKDYSDEQINNLTWNERTELLQKDPETSTEYFDHRGQQFIYSVLKSPFNPIGKIIDFFHRIEFQQRGSPHIHMLAWVENAPKYQVNSTAEIINFVNNYVKCSKTATENSSTAELIELQIHKHSKSCRKKGKAVCRFGFPLPPLPETMVLEPLETDVDKYKKKYTELQKKLNELKEGSDLSYEDFLEQIVEMTEEEYIKCIRSSLNGPKVFIKRKPSEIRVNYYNDTILRAWKANLDIQFVLDPYACAMYIVSYISKSQRGISAILDKASKEAKEGNMDIKRQVRHIGNKFLNFVEVSAQEACYLVLQLPLTRASRDIVFINTSPPEERVFLLKGKEELDTLPPESTDVETDNIIQRYAKRPRQLENWCLADYVSKLEIKFPKSEDREQAENTMHNQNIEHDSNEDENDFSEEDIIVSLKNGIVIKRRRNPKVIRYVRYSKKTNSENYYRERILLFLPWRNETVDLFGGNDTYEQYYLSKKHIIDAKAKEYEHHVEELEQARLQAERELDEYDELAPNTQQVEAEDEEEGTIESDEFVHFNPDSIEHAHVDIGAELGVHTNVSSVIDVSPIRMPDEQYAELLRSLNVKQREFFNHVIHWIKTKDEPLYAFLSGGAGVGKSVVIRALYQALHRQLCSKEGESPDDIRILLCAYTGKAAYNINGSTIASAFHKKMYQSQQNMLADELNTFRTKYRNLAVIIIDEISMVGSNLLIFINERLKQLTMATGRDFGAISIIAVGDLYQLQPIGDPWIFAEPTKPGQGLATNLWKKHFKLFELTEVMRQKEDLQFAQLLNRLRHNNLSENDMDIIHSRLTKRFAVDYPTAVPHLFTENKFVNNFNNDMIQTLPTMKVTVLADTDVIIHTNLRKDQKNQLLNALPDDSTKTGQLSKVLTIAVEMIYDVSVNVDVDDGLANGSTCVVKFIEFRNESRTRPAIIWVYFEDQNIGAKRRTQCKNLYTNLIDATWTPIFETKRTFLFNRNTYDRTQFPLQPSAAKTIHKAQGCTVDKLVLDLSQTKVRKIPHIHYVALSRVRSLQNLYILNFNEKALKVDEHVEIEMERLRHDSPLVLCYTPVYKLDPSTRSYMFHNARSLHKHFPDISSDPNVLACDIVGIAESRLTSSDSDEDYILDGFDIFRNDEETSTLQRPYHGLVLYVKKTINVRQIIKFHNNELEFIFANLEYSNTYSVQTVILYKYPKCSLNKYKLYIISQLLNLVDISKKLLILGDFNFDINDGHAAFCQFMQDTFSCTQVVNKATTDYQSKLDLIFTNFDKLLTDVIEAYWSDHKMVYCAVEV